MSSSQAKSFHSINIGNKNTWDDWHLVPTSRPLVSPPPVQTHVVEIPGSSEFIDLTETISGRPTYGNRTGSWDFYVINSGQVVYNSSYDVWYERYSTIMDYLQGQLFDIILDDDPAYYYTGRLEVGNWNSAKGNSIIKLSYNVDPYKRDVYGANSRWLWDPFNFETGVIKSYKDLVVRGNLTVTYIAGATSSVPVITVSANGMSVTYNSTAYILSKGANVMNDMHFTEGNNTLIFSGNGRVTIEAIGGIL